MYNSMQIHTHTHVGPHAYIPKQTHSPLRKFTYRLPQRYTYTDILSYTYYTYTAPLCCSWQIIKDDTIKREGFFDRNEEVDF